MSKHSCVPYKYIMFANENYYLAVLSELEVFVRVHGILEYRIDG